MSYHRFDDGKYYPYEIGDLNNIGKEKGKGFSINVPWSMK